MLSAELAPAATVTVTPTGSVRPAGTMKFCWPLPIAVLTGTDQVAKVPDPVVLVTLTVRAPVAGLNAVTVPVMVLPELPAPEAISVVVCPGVGPLTPAGSRKFWGPVLMVFGPT